MLPPLELNQKPKESAETVKGCAKHGLVFSSPDNFDPATARFSSRALRCFTSEVDVRNFLMYLEQ